MALLDYLYSRRCFFMKARDTLVALAIKYKGDWDRMMRSINEKESIETEYIRQVEKLKCKVTTIFDADYPQQLKSVHKAPFVLFYYGDISLIQDYGKNVSIVGSRDYSEYGEKMTIDIASGLAKKGYNIVSGLALGVDSIAHTSAIRAGGTTTAVLGNGIDFCYLKTNEDLYEYLKENQLVISEYPGLVPADPSNFPIRNRIIAGLSKTLVVTEAGYHSGSMVTALLALQGDADVMCVPYEAGSESECNRLIKGGAYLVEGVNDVLDQMSFIAKNVK